MSSAMPRHPSPLSPSDDTSHTRARDDHWGSVVVEAEGETGMKVKIKNAPPAVPTGDPDAAISEAAHINGDEHTVTAERYGNVLVLHAYNVRLGKTTTTAVDLRAVRVELATGTQAERDLIAADRVCVVAAVVVLLVLTARHSVPGHTHHQRHSHACAYALCSDDLVLYLVSLLEYVEVPFCRKLEVAGVTGPGAVVDRGFSKTISDGEDYWMLGLKRSDDRKAVRGRCGLPINLVRYLLTWLHWWTAPQRRWKRLCSTQTPMSPSPQVCPWTPSQSGSPTIPTARH